MFSDILQAQDYHADDPFIRDAIDQQIRLQLVNIAQKNIEQINANKGKSSQDQSLKALNELGDFKFKYLLTDDNALDFDYEEEEKRIQDKLKVPLAHPKFRVLGYRYDPFSKLNLPILKLSDVYVSTNPRVKRLIDKVFELRIYGKNQTKKAQAGVQVSKSTSNVQQLERLLKKYQNNLEEQNFSKQDTKMNEQQLEDYIIDKGDCKSNYFLFYKNQSIPEINYQVVNNPLKSENFLKKLHAEVRQKQRQYYMLEDPQSDEEKLQEAQNSKGQTPQKPCLNKKKKEYFGQFKPPGKKLKSGTQIKMQDRFSMKNRQGQALAKSIINYYSYMDSDILKQQYKKSQAENDRLELNLSNPYFFQPKLHSILNHQVQLQQQSQYKSKLAQASKNKSNTVQKSIYTGAHFNKSALGEETQNEGLVGQSQRQNVSIESKINEQIKNISRQPIKHSEIAKRYQYVRFTFEQSAFHSFHRHIFQFQEHLRSNLCPKIEIHCHRNRKIKPNGLVINAQMKQSNEKFIKNEDLSCTKGEFIIVQYIEQTPLLLSNVGMCERMVIQVNYLEILSKMRERVIEQKSFQEAEKDRDLNRSQMSLSYIQHAELWRKTIKDTFGQNGKLFYWQPKLTGKVVGIPNGPGVAVMESNLGTVPIVKKKPNPRDYLLVRDGKRWVLRKIQTIYVSGQIEPNKKVFYPGSKQHLDFKLAYEKAYILKQMKEHQNVNFDQLKLYFRGQTQNSLKRALKACNAISKDAKNFKMNSESPKEGQQALSPEDICIYERMQKSICELKEVGIREIRLNQKIKNVMNQFTKRHYLSNQKIAISRVIRQQLQLTSWFLIESFLKYKLKSSKIEISGFADPTNGRGGYSFIHKPHKQITSQQEVKLKSKTLKGSAADLRKLNSEDSRQKLRALGHNEDEIQEKTRWGLVNILKAKEGTEFTRKQRESKLKKQENEKREISKNFNKLLAWLRDETEEPAFDYARAQRNNLANYIVREKEYIEKIRSRYSVCQRIKVGEGNNQDASDDQN